MAGLLGKIKQEWSAFITVSTLFPPKTQIMLRIVGYHEVFTPLHAAEFYLSLQPAVVQVFPARPTHHVHLVCLIFHFHELVQIFSSANGIV